MIWRWAFRADFTPAGFAATTTRNLPTRVSEKNAACISALFPDLFKAADCTPCRVPSFFRVYALGQIFFDLLLEMETQFVIEFVLDASAPKERAHTQQKFVGQAHHSHLKATIGSTRAARRAGR